MWEELGLKEQKKGGGISFMSKKQRLELQLARLDEREQKLKETREKKMADLLLLGNEDSEEEGLGFKYKISPQDYALLQQAKEAQGIQQVQAQLGF